MKASKYSHHSAPGIAGNHTIALKQDHYNDYSDRSKRLPVAVLPANLLHPISDKMKDRLIRRKLIE